MGKIVRPEVDEINRLAAALHGTDDAAVAYTLQSLQDHVDEVALLREAGDEHWKAETMDILIHALTLLRRGGMGEKDMDALMAQRLARFKDKIVKQAARQKRLLKRKAVMSKKILLIDDDPTSGRLVQGRLCNEGYAVVIATTGEAGLVRLEQEKPDLVILDIEMPEMNGYTFIVEMKKKERVKDTPVIVLTAHQENRAIFVRRGIKHYLVKPVNFNDLLSKITELVGK